VGIHGRSIISYCGGRVKKGFPFKKREGNWRYLRGEEKSTQHSQRKRLLSLGKGLKKSESSKRGGGPKGRGGGEKKKGGNWFRLAGGRCKHEEKPERESALYHGVRRKEKQVVATTSGQESLPWGERGGEAGKRKNSDNRGKKGKSTAKT